MSFDENTRKIIFVAKQVLVISLFLLFRDSERSGQFTDSKLTDYSNESMIFYANKIFVYLIANF